jgi:hypothetical protein
MDRRRLVIRWFKEHNFNICIAFNYRAHDSTNFIQKVAACDEKL